MLCQETSDLNHDDKEHKTGLAAYFICQYLQFGLKRVLAYPPTSVPLTFPHIDGLKISTDKSTLFSKLEVRIITDAPGNEDVRTVNKMFLVLSHVDLPSTFGGEANITLSRLVRRANHIDFACDTYKYPFVNDIAREDHDLV